MMDAAPLSRPELTLPAAEAAWLRDAYGAAARILEYGSGGSTVIAAEQPGTTVWSVESDETWVRMMQAWFQANPARGAVHLHHVAIGPTGKWGGPKNGTGWRHYPRYPLSVWDRPDFRQPDLVLIDGRFRVGCLLAALARSASPVTVLFDDYTNRPHYHVVEEFVGAPAETRGRMARFDLVPRAIRGDEILTFVEAMSVPD